MYLLLLLIIYFVLGLHHSFMYRDPDYVCRHMARDLEINLEKIGIDTVIVSNGDYMWIKVFGVEFDSVSLLPMVFVRSNYGNGSLEYYNSYEEWMGAKNVSNNCYTDI